MKNCVRGAEGESSGASPSASGSDSRWSFSNRLAGLAAAPRPGTMREGFVTGVSWIGILRWKIISAAGAVSRPPDRPPAPGRPRQAARAGPNPNVVASAARFAGQLICCSVSPRRCRAGGSTLHQSASSVASALCAESCQRLDATRLRLRAGRKGLRAGVVSPESNARASSSIQIAGFLF